MGKVKQSIQKARVGDVIGILADKTWEGIPALDYLFRQMGGMPGDESQSVWTYKAAAEAASKEFGLTIRHWHTYRFYQQRAAAEMIREKAQIIEEAKLSLMASSPSVKPERLAETMALITAGILIQGGETDDAARALNAITNYEKSCTERQKLEQRAKEHDESVASLKAQLNKLKDTIAKGGNEENQEAHRKELADAVDKALELT